MSAGIYTPKRAVRDYLAEPGEYYLLPPKPLIRDYLAEPFVVAESGGYVQRSVESAVHLRVEGSGSPLLEGRMVPYGEWTEINSRAEGHFLERFAPGSLAKTLKEHASRIRVLFEHGQDATIGLQPIAKVEELRERADGAHYTARLLDGVPQLVLAGLRAGLYGSSVRFFNVKTDRERYPRRSAHNPEGLEERTVREARIREFSVVTFPAYVNTAAQVRE